MNTNNQCVDDEKKKIKRRSKEYLFKRSKYNIPIKNLTNRKAKRLQISKKSEIDSGNIKEEATKLRSYKDMKKIKIKIPHKKLQSRKSKLISETDAQMLLLDIKYNTHIILEDHSDK
jgi:hypothetical protein